MRLINILIFVFLGLTVLLVAIHIQKTEYFESPSHDIIEELYSGQAKVSTRLTSYENDGYEVNFSIYHIKADLVVEDIDIELIKITENENIKLELLKVLPYSGMHNWDIPEFKNFSRIPKDLRRLNTSSNPYFAYDFIFRNKSKKAGDKFKAKISARFIEDGKQITFTKELLILKKSKFEVKPLDAHSDITFLFIPLTSFITVVLLIIKAYQVIRAKHSALIKTHKATR